MWRRLAFAFLLPALPLAAQAPERLELPADRESIIAAGWQMVIYHDDGAIERLPVTDAALDIVTWEGDPVAAIRSDDAPGRSPWSSLFYADLTLVAGDRLFRHGGGVCSPFDADFAICSVECDGGHFAMRRTLMQDAARLEVILTPLPDLIDGDESAAIRFSDCGGGAIAALDRTGDRPASATFDWKVWDR
jgi:hypothetical protein